MPANKSQTRSFGSSNREGHDSSDFYSRFAPPSISQDIQINYDQSFAAQIAPGECFEGDSRAIPALDDNSIGLVVTSPPYFVGKDYEIDLTSDGNARIPQSYVDYLEMLTQVFAECVRVLEPGGRICVNVANLGRKPYRSLASDVVRILQDDLGLLLRGEILWRKSKASSGSCAWGSFCSANNPVLRDVTERVIVASKGRFDRALAVKQRKKLGLPHQSTLSTDEFMEATTDVWEIEPESANRVGHPAPFPTALALRLINLYSFEGDMVLDPFCGSGTSLVAAGATGRVGVGFDNVIEYVALANKRLTDETAELAESLAPYRQAVSVSATVQAIAKEFLSTSGYWVSESKKDVETPSGVGFDFRAVDADGAVFMVTVCGAFTVTDRGLNSLSECERVVGLAKSVPAGHRVMALTTKLPKGSSQAHRLLNWAIGEGSVVVQVMEPQAVLER